MTTDQELLRRARTAFTLAAASIERDVRLTDLTDEETDRLLIAALQSQPVAIPEGMTPAEAWQELIEYDDRNSPEEYPEMALITSDELTSFMQRASPAPVAPTAMAVRKAVVEECAKVAETATERTNADWDSDDGSLHAAGYEAACDDIAAAIRALASDDSQGDGGGGG